MGLQAAVHLGHMPWALTKEEEAEELLWLILKGYDSFPFTIFHILLVLLCITVYMLVCFVRFCLIL
jgi:hypothetical protein